MSATLSVVKHGETGFTPSRKIGFGALDMYAAKTTAWASAGAFVGSIGAVVIARAMPPRTAIITAVALGLAAIASGAWVGGAFGTGMAGILGATAVSLALTGGRLR